MQMTAKSEVASIKAEVALTDDERVWKAIERLAELVDQAPKDATQEISRQFRRGGL